MADFLLIPPLPNEPGAEQFYQLQQAFQYLDVELTQIKNLLEPYHAEHLISRDLSGQWKRYQMLALAIGKAEYGFGWPWEILDASSDGGQTRIKVMPGQIVVGSQAGAMEVVGIWIDPEAKCSSIPKGATHAVYDGSIIFIDVDIKDWSARIKVGQRSKPWASWPSSVEFSTVDGEWEQTHAYMAIGEVRSDGGTMKLTDTLFITQALITHLTLVTECTNGIYAMTLWPYAGAVGGGPC